MPATTERHPWNAEAGAWLGKHGEESITDRGGIAGMPATTERHPWNAEAATAEGMWRAGRGLLG